MSAEPSWGTSVARWRLRLLGRLLLFGLAVLLTQALLRRPLAGLFAGDRFSTVTVVEAAIAVAALAGVFGLLVWMYETARPIVQMLTRRALDAAIPTVGTPPVAEPTRTVVPPGAADEPTVRSRSAAEEPTIVSPHQELTVRRSRDDEPTLPSA